MSKNIVFEGWLTKSPPSKRIWRTKWRRRWFALRQSGELPGQYFLDYYEDQNCRRLKGTINLDLCEQVDAGLHMERSGGNGTLDPKLRGSVFTIQTQSRTYHLEADCEADMEKWVDAICQVCGLRATDEASFEIGTHQNTAMAATASSQTEHNADSTGPYIPISECITGVRAQDSQRAFTFETENTSSFAPLELVTNSRDNQMYTSQPQIRLHNTEFSENESNLSEDECRSLNAIQPKVIRDYSVTRSFTKLDINREKNGHSVEGPPVPPRPPKTFAMSREMFQKETQNATKAQETPEALDTAYGNRMSRRISPGGAEPLSPIRSHVMANVVVRDEEEESPSRQQAYGLRVPRSMSQRGAAPPSPIRSHVLASAFIRDDEDLPSRKSVHYCNLPCIPPAVDRALKPRSSTYNIANYIPQNTQHIPREETKDVLQYLDLDLSDPKSPDSKKKVTFIHGKSLSAADADPAYKTVDFLKTEALDITRQDAEAKRSNY